MNLLLRFLEDDSAVSMVEYTLLLGLIMVAVVSVITAFGTNINSAISKGSSQLIT